MASPRAWQVGAKRPRSPVTLDEPCHSPEYIKQVMTFNGAGESVEAPVPKSMRMGGSAGLTVVARVRRRKKGGGPAWDRLIDFGNGAEKENIVINFQVKRPRPVEVAHAAPLFARG